MCGLFGAFGANLMPADGNVLKDLALVSMTRGIHSTGVANISNQYLKGLTASRRVSITKNTVDAAGFLLTKEGNESLSLTGSSTFRAVLGHCRHATVGDVTRACAHPYEVDNKIFGCHNGTINSMRPPQAVHHEFTDSLILFQTINAVGLEEALAKAGNGAAFALTFFDRTADTINIIRNSQRPLFLMEKAGSNAIFYASEWRMLEFAAGDAEHEIEMVPEDTLLTYSLTAGAKLESTPFADYRKKIFTTGGTAQKTGRTFPVATVEEFSADTSAIEGAVSQAVEEGAKKDEQEPSLMVSSPAGLPDFIKRPVVQTIAHPPSAPPSAPPPVPLLLPSPSATKEKGGNKAELRVPAVTTFHQRLTKSRDHSDRLATPEYPTFGVPSKKAQLRLKRFSATVVDGKPYVFKQQGIGLIASSLFPDYLKNKQRYPLAITDKAHEGLRLLFYRGPYGMYTYAGADDLVPLLERGCTVTGEVPSSLATDVYWEIENPEYYILRDNLTPECLRDYYNRETARGGITDLFTRSALLYMDPDYATVLNRAKSKELLRKAA